MPPCDIQPIKKQLGTIGQQLLAQFARQLPLLLSNHLIPGSSPHSERLYCWLGVIPSAWLTVHHDFEMQMTNKFYDALQDSDKQAILAEFVKAASSVLYSHEQAFFKDL